MAATREQLDQEARGGRIAAAAAFGAALLLAPGMVYLGSRYPGTSGGFLRDAHAHPTGLYVAAVVQGLGLLCLAVALQHLYWACKLRRPETPAAARVLTLAGPVVAAALGIAFYVIVVQTADDFVHSTVRTSKHADDLLRDGAGPVVGGIGAAGRLAIAIGLVLLCIHAIRAGVLSRFMGILGVFVGAMYVLPIPALPVIQLFWLAALGALFLNRWPGGRGPAWEAGEAIPWPGAAERRARAQAEAPDPPG